MFGLHTEAHAQLNTNGNEITVTIDGNTSRMDLIQIRTALLEQGVDFKYDMQFNESTRLKSINFTLELTPGVNACNGQHNQLQNQGAKIEMVINRNNGTCQVTSVE